MCRLEHSFQVCACLNKDCHCKEETCCTLPRVSRSFFPKSMGHVIPTHCRRKEYPCSKIKEALKRKDLLIEPCKEVRTKYVVLEVEYCNQCWLYCSENWASPKYRDRALKKYMKKMNAHWQEQQRQGEKWEWF